MGSVEPAMARCSDSECGFSVGRTVLGQDAVIDSVAPATQARCSDSGWWLQCWPDRPWSPYQGRQGNAEATNQNPSTWPVLRSPSRHPVSGLSRLSRPVASAFFSSDSPRNEHETHETRLRQP